MYTAGGDPGGLGEGKQGGRREKGEKEEPVAWEKEG